MSDWIQRIAAIEPLEDAIFCAELVADMERNAPLSVGRAIRFSTPTFNRASGAGGQHVNRTESAIRITHLPSGIVVACQSDRSQHKNRSTAMKQLQSKLYDMEMQKRRATQQILEDGKSDIGWGSQIRSYVLDQSRIKDLRTGVETGNTGAVLDGDLDEFIEASLKSGL